MIRWVYGIGVSLVLAAFVHLATVFLVPKLASRGPFERTARAAPLNTMTVLPPAPGWQEMLPQQDTAFVLALCRYDLAEGPLQIKVPVTPAYTALAFHDTRGVAYYALNDRAAGRKVIELELMTAAQKEELPEDEEITAADRLIVVSPTSTGLVLARGLIAEPGLEPQVRAALARGRCGQAISEAETPAPPPSQGQKPALRNRAPAGKR